MMLIRQTDTYMGLQLSLRSQSLQRPDDLGDECNQSALAMRLAADQGILWDVMWAAAAPRSPAPWSMTTSCSASSRPRTWIECGLPTSRSIPPAKGSCMCARSRMPAPIGSWACPWGHA